MCIGFFVYMKVKTNGSIINIRIIKMWITTIDMIEIIFLMVKIIFSFNYV